MFAWPTGSHPDPRPCDRWPVDHSRRLPYGFCVQLFTQPLRCSHPRAHRSPRADDHRTPATPPPGPPAARPAGLAPRHRPLPRAARPPLDVAGGAGRVTSVRSQTPDTVTLTLRPNDAWTGFEAGQFVRAHGRGRRRAPHPLLLPRQLRRRARRTDRAHRQGARPRHGVAPPARPARPASSSPCRPPRAPSPCRPSARPSWSSISGGSGITPVLSMLRTLCRRGAPRAGHVPALRARRAGTCSTATSWPRSTGAHPNVRIVHAYTDQDRGAEPARLLRARPPPRCRAPARRGRDLRLRPDRADRRGARPLRAEGLSDRLHVESSHRSLAAPVDDADAVSGDLVLRPQRPVGPPNTGATLLDQAEAAGLTPESGCRMGICHTCTAARPRAPSATSAPARSAPTPTSDIQLCVNVPVGDVELVV